MSILRPALFVLCLASPAFAGDLTIHSRFPGGTDLMQPGTMINPYIVQDRTGHQVGTIRSQLPDLTPHDGLMDAGSQANPWVLHTHE